MKSLLAAMSFLTRVPVGRWAAFDASDVGRSAGWFPLIGIVLGAIYAAAAWPLREHLPLLLLAVILVALDAVLTGALHFDGLADTADGFGGGKDRDDVLRIMRDHSIGSYGGVALVLLIGLKVAAYSVVLQRDHWFIAMVLTAGLSRWSMLLLTATLPYARAAESVIEKMGKTSLIWGTLTMLCALSASQFLRAWIATAAVVVVTLGFGLYCRHRIGGITGDILGANLQLCESVALIAFLWT
jgi:adenosylcobinamide-GDP ribazoletransferase